VVPFLGLNWVCQTRKLETVHRTRCAINIQDDQELKSWSEGFGVTPDQLRAAVWKVGVMADDVEEELNDAKGG
jgi:hypothetical protein